MCEGLVKVALVFHSTSVVWTLLPLREGTICRSISKTMLLDLDKYLSPQYIALHSFIGKYMGSGLEVLINDDENIKSYCTVKHAIL